MTILADRAVRSGGVWAVLGVLTVLSGCGSFGSKNGKGIPETTCVAPQPGVFATAAERLPDRASAMSYIDRLGSKARMDGDLIITEEAVRFVSCEADEAERKVFAVPHEATELVYRDRNWLFLRPPKPAEGYREFVGFAIKGTTRTSGEERAKAALQELQQRRARKGLFVTPAEPVAMDLAIVSRGEPDLRIASVDRGDVGKNVAQGMAGGALGGVAAGVLTPIMPGVPLILYPPAAAVLIVGGTVVGAAAGPIVAEREAKSKALMVPLEDAVLNKALHEMKMGPTLARRVESLLAAEPRWHVGVVNEQGLDCGDLYRDCALRGILGVVAIPPPRLEFRADKADLLKDEDQAKQALSIFQSVYLYSTLSGSPVEIIEITARSDRHSMAEWRENDGARLRRAVQEAMQPMPDVIAMRLQRALGKLITFN